MKSILFLSVAFVMVLKGSAQYADTEQPDSIYKVNHVKKRIARYEKYGLQNCNVNSYDLNGRLMERTMFDKSGKKVWLQTVFEYNTTGNLVSESFNSYMNIDSLTYMDKPDTVLDSSKVNVYKFEYDSLNRLIKITGTISPGKTPYAASYFYNPFTSVAKYYKFKDSIVTIDITIYETPNISKTHFSSYDSAVVTKNTLQETYKNIFDKSGNILRRIKETPGDPGFCMEIIYEYNDKGLLVKKSEQASHCNSPDCIWAILFDYEYWDKSAVQPILFVNKNRR